MILAEVFDSTIRGSKDITKVIEMVPLATIPVIQNFASRAASRRQLLLVTSLSLAVVIGFTIILIAKMA